MGNGISKRKFIKKGILGTGAMACGLPSLDLFSGISKNLEPCTQSNINFDTHFIEALYYTSTPKGFKCLLCPNECKIKENEEGDCRTRINRDNMLECIAYGNPCAIHVDPIEKKPLYHFLPATKTFSIATAGCNLACLNCQNWEISQTSPTKTRNYELMPEAVVEKCKETKCNSIAYTYSDPVAFYEYVMDTAKMAREENIKNIIVSAGYINEKPLREWCKYIDAANIDLKSFSNEIYEMLNAGTLEPVLRTLKILKEEGVWLEITNLVVPNWTDDMNMIKQMCDWLTENGFSDTPLHFSRFHPQYKLTDLPKTPINTLTDAKQVAVNAGMNYVYIGNSPETGPSVTYCPGCKTSLISRKGYHVLHNNITDGKCGECESEINGCWK